ncbi:hypothetical protein NLG97_g1187 [Lecanicillium saksenae]|uniref:Uncharacterized protein n=1 Tax=Lecanicillium saksenae TaxID=468837 RepID=A0ACC1R672_9HYPO|nr:hypothetical protein NLG97_g1187 [Lecanicillium saksenae]
MGEAQFMIEDPSKTLALSQHRQQFNCQTCFVSFSTKRKLREHVAAYQLEGQRLAARLVEVQMHLPLTRNYWNEVAATSVTSGETHETESDYHDDDEDDDDDDNDDDDDDDDDNAEHPDPNRKRATGHNAISAAMSYAFIAEALS